MDALAAVGLRDDSAWWCLAFERPLSEPVTLHADSETYLGYGHNDHDVATPLLALGATFAWDALLSGVVGLEFADT